MKRYIVAYLSMLIVSQVAIGSVDFLLSSPSAGVVTIGYRTTAGEQIMGIALNVSLSDSAFIEPATCVLNSSRDYSIDFDSGFGLPFGGDPQPVSNFSINFGSFEPFPASVNNLISFQIQDGGQGLSYVTISKNMLRGGVVGNYINSVTMPQPLLVTVPEPATIGLLAIGTLSLVRKRRK